jgi:hypothetical protein
MPTFTFFAIELVLDFLKWILLEPANFLSVNFFYHDAVTKVGNIYKRENEERSCKICCYNFKQAELAKTAMQNL